MGYPEIYVAATRTESALYRQVVVAVFRAAQDVTNEDAGTANHANRLAWANDVLTQDGLSPTNEAKRWIWKVLENATIQTNPSGATDSDVQFVTNAIVNEMANAHAEV